MKRVSIVLLMSLAVFFACQHNPEMVQPKLSNESLSIKEAKLWFEKDFLKNQNSGRVEGNNDDKFEHNLKWDKSIKSKISKERDLIIIPVETKRNGKPYNTNSNAWIYKDDVGKEQIRIVDFSLPNNQNEIIDFLKFSGMMVMREYNGKLINGYAFDKGEAIGIAENIGKEVPEWKKSNKKGKINNQVCYYNNIYSTCRDYYYQNCTLQWNGQWSCEPIQYNFTSCTITGTDLICQWYNSTGVSGSTASTGYTSSNAASIGNHLTNPCFSNVLNNLILNNFRLTASDIIAHFYNVPNLYISFSNANIGGTNLDGYTQLANATYNNSWNITLNDLALVNASKEYIAVTILHEALHAYFDSIGKYGELLQHNTMANQYVSKMASALIRYYPYRITFEEAIALSWGGLDASSAWRALSESDKTKYILINDRFKNLNGQNYAVGTRCN